MKRLLFILALVFTLNIWADDVRFRIGSEAENYVLDVVLETDIFDMISEYESKELDMLWDDEDPAAYFIRLIELYGKYIDHECVLQ